MNYVIVGAVIGAIIGAVGAVLDEWMKWRAEKQYERSIPTEDQSQ